jgi:hypothetical protein
LCVQLLGQGADLVFESLDLLFVSNFNLSFFPLVIGNSLRRCQVNVPHRNQLVVLNAVLKSLIELEQPFFQVPIDHLSVIIDYAVIILERESAFGLGG